VAALTGNFVPIIAIAGLQEAGAPGVPGLFSQTPRAGLAPTPRPHASGVVSTQGPGIKRRLESGGNPV